MRWETVQDCNFCGSAGTRSYLKLTTSNWYDNQPLNLEECTSCRLVRATPRPERRDLYRGHLLGTVRALQHVRRRMTRPNIVANHRRLLENAAQFAKRPLRTVYEMGCGAGTILMSARTLGMEGEGNDVNLVAVKMLQELGFKVRHGFTKELDFHEMSYDGVVAFNYLEESYEPFEDLRRSYDLLKPGGVAYIRSLYLGCPEHRAAGEAWKIFGAGYFHYYYPETLRSMIEAAGLKILDTRLLGVAIVIAIRED
jgi:SAM-dependent methyltransferase